MEATVVLPWYKTSKMVDVALCALIFFIPLSSSLKSIALIFSVLAILRYRIDMQTMTTLFSQSWVRMLGIFLLWVGIESFLSPANWAQQGYVLEKYSKLLWLPILSLGFTEARQRRLGLQVFLAAMFITAVSALALHDWGLIATQLPAGSVFRNHIITGHMMAFAAYLAGWFAFQRTERCGLYLVLLGVFTYELLFVSQGRTGYVMYFVLMALLLIQELRSWRRMLSLLGLLLFAGVTFFSSTVMHHRYEKAQKDMVLLKQDHHRTSIGYRMEFQKFSYALLQERPLTGHGTGSFTYYFTVRNPIPAWQKIAREPHSQYWMVATEFGVIGLLLYLIWLGCTWGAIRRLSIMRKPAMALLIPFLIGSYSESLLFFSGCGYFFLTMLALCLGESLCKECS